MWLVVKADLLRCLESDLLEDSVNSHAPIPDATILYGAVVVQVVNPEALRAFQGYGESVFAPYVHTQLDKSNLVDIVWDVYQPASLKSSTIREKGERARGGGWLLLL